MGLLTGFQVTPPVQVTAAIINGIIQVDDPATPFAAVIVDCLGSVPPPVVIPPVPTTCSITPAIFALTTQGQTQQLTATVKDQFGNVLPTATVTWSTTDSRVTVSGTGLVTAVGTGASATIRATVVGFATVIGAATISTPASIPTTLTVNAGFGTPGGGGTGAGFLVGVTVNNAYETHKNYAQNYTFLTGPGTIATEEVFEGRWISNVNSPTSITANFSAFTQEFARLQAIGCKLKLYVGFNYWPGMAAACDTAPHATTVLATIATTITSFFNTPGSPAAYNGASAYVFGNTVTSGGNKWTCIANCTGVTPAIGAKNSSGAYCWYQTQVGTVYAYNLANEGVSFGGTQLNPISAKLGAITSWLPGFAQQIHTGDPGAKLELNGNHYAYDGSGGESTAQTTLTMNTLAALVTAGGVGGASNLIFGIEAHIQCDLMQNQTGGVRGWDKAGFTALLNSITAAGYGYSITELDVDDGMFPGTGTAGIPLRLQAIATAYSNYLAAVRAATAKPDHVIVWNLRDPENWLDINHIGTRADGLPQHPDLYFDFNGTPNPALAVWQNWLNSYSSVQSSLVLNDNLLHPAPVTLTDQWGANMSLGVLTWSSTNPTGIAVTAGVIQALSGSQAATISASYPSPVLSASISVTSSAPVATAVSLSPGDVTLSGGTVTQVPTEVDQFNVAIAGGGSGNGPVIVFAAGGKGLTANIAGIASASTLLWTKGRILVDCIRACPLNSGIALQCIDSDGAGTNPKWEVYFHTGGTAAVQLVGAPFKTGGIRIQACATSFINDTALSANGNYIEWFAGYDQVAGHCILGFFDTNGNAFNDGAHVSTATVTVASAPLLNTDGGVNGRVSVNKGFNVNAVSRATTQDGQAIYTSALPAVGSQWTRPLVGDTGIQGGWYMGDASSGAITSAAAFVGTALTCTSATGATGDANSWSPAIGGGGGPFTWSSDATGVATVNSSGVVTFVGNGVVNIGCALTSNPNVDGTAVVTCQATQTATTLSVTPTALTLGANTMFPITTTVGDQFGQVFQGATTFTFNSSAPSVATVSGTGVITWVGPGSATVTTTLTSVTPNLVAATAVTALPATTTNEPSGMTAQINTGAITAIPAGLTLLSPSTPTSSGEWSGNLTLVPSANGSGLRITYPSTVSGGFSPVRFIFSIATPGTSTFYIRFLIRYSANWTNNGNAGTKIFEPRWPNNSNNNSENHVIGGRCDNPPAIDQYLQFLLQGPAGNARNIPQPAISGSLGTWSGIDPNGQLAGPTRGTWHKCELVAVAESTPGNGDGVATGWVDSVQAFTASDVQWLASGDSWGLASLLCDPTYGGGTQNPPSITPSIFWDIDQLYVSTK